MKRTRDQSLQRGIRILAISLLGAAIVPAVWGIQQHQHALSSSSWPTVEGKIIESRRKPNRVGRRTRAYSIAFRYEYQVKGKAFSSDRVAFGFFAPRSPELYSEEQIVQVYYDATDPASAVLDPGASRWTLGVYVAIALALGATGLLCYRISYSL